MWYGVCMDDNTVDAELVTSYPVPAHIIARESLDKNPEENITSLCRHISEGGSGIDWAEAHGVPYGELHQWALAKPRTDRYNAALFARNEWTRQRLLGTLRDLAFADITDVYNPDGTIKPYAQWSSRSRMAVSSVEITESRDGDITTKKLKFADKLKAIELMMKNMGMLLDVIQVDNRLSVDKEAVAALSTLPADKLTDMILGRK